MVSKVRIVFVFMSVFLKLNMSAAITTNGLRAYDVADSRPLKHMSAGLGAALRSVGRGERLLKVINFYLEKSRHVFKPCVGCLCPRSNILLNSTRLQVTGNTAVLKSTHQSNSRRGGQPRIMILVEAALKFFSADVHDGKRCVLLRTPAPTDLGREQASLFAANTIITLTVKAANLLDC